jgi:hypothetical protein
VAERTGTGDWTVSEISPNMFGHPTIPVSATERETQSFMGLNLLNFFLLNALR